MARYEAVLVVASIITIIFVFIGATNCAHLKLSLYYESQCKESARFITTEVYPTSLKFGGVGNKYFEVELIPYGKATTEFINGSFEFNCQHGEKECLGNKIQACALAKLPLVDAFAFINCSMKLFNPPVGDEECATYILDLNSPRLENCYTSWEGSVLLAYNGIRTKELRPSMYYLPWPVFNGVFTLGELGGAQKDLLSLVCRKLEKMNVNTTQCSKSTE